MKFLKNTAVAILLILTFGLVAHSYNLYFKKPCDDPIRYKIGRFDPQFKISKSEFKTAAEKSELVWEVPLGREAFVYDENADFTVNLIYDQRQFGTLQKEKAESGFDVFENDLEQLDAGFAARKLKYETDLAVYKSEMSSFESRQKNYEAEVEYWNQNGGAPRAKYNELNQTSVSLNAEAATLNKTMTELNLAAKELNLLLEERNNAAREYNKMVAEYNQKYGHGLEFDQAEYTGNEINIYQFNNKEDLHSALSHEFGHALGMDHVDNKNSIMHYITEGGKNQKLEPTSEDLSELKRVCEFE